MTETFYMEEIGSRLILYSFAETETEFKSEYLVDEVWIQDNSLVNIPRDSRSKIYKEISKEQAENCQTIRRFNLRRLRKGW